MSAPVLLGLAIMVSAELVKIPREQAAALAVEALRAEQASAEQLRSALKQVQETDPANLLVAELVNGLSKTADAADLRRALREARDLLSFRPRMEAKMPEGFPEPTPVGEIRVQDYPSYRLARAVTQGDRAFMTLFNHIKTNGVAMTAPVEMTRPKEQQTPATMAFLYGSRAIGELGQQGKVEVVDSPAFSAVSMGLRGYTTDQAIGAAEQRLNDWLAAHPEYTRSGPLKVLGYNSPFMPGPMRYFEVQYPVTRQRINDAP